MFMRRMIMLHSGTSDDVNTRINLYTTVNRNHYIHITQYVLIKGQCSLLLKV